MTVMRPEKGTYALLLYLGKRMTFADVGPFGTISLPAGHYLYVGSAHGSGGVRGRVGHHLRPRRRALVWHLDYVRPAMRAVEVWLTYDPDQRECAWAGLIHAALGGAVPVPGLGSADERQWRRRARCPAHFFHFGRRPRYEAFRAAVGRWLAGHGPVELIDEAAVATLAAQCRAAKAGRSLPQANRIRGAARRCHR
jgi:Uri superfamily endonuclease